MIDKPIRAIGNPMDCIHRARTDGLTRLRAGRLHKINITTRRTPSALFFALVLAFAVCCWGLHSKLSLYHCGPTSFDGHAAKLLSPKERPLASKHIDSLQPPSGQSQSRILLPLFLIAAIAIVSPLMLPGWFWNLTTDADCRQGSCVDSSCFLPRPPPPSPLLK